MKHLLLYLFLLLSGTSFSQYFNIFPSICDSTASGEFHYVIGGVEDFTDSLELILNVELLTDTEQLDLIVSRVYDLSDTTTFAGLTFDGSNSSFTIDLGNYAARDYILHMWVAIAEERYDEIYYQQP